MNIKDNDFSLAQLYHLNTKTTSSLIPIHHLSQAEHLPKQDPMPSLDMIDAVCNRRSIRRWNHQSMSIMNLSTLLLYGAGIVRVEERSESRVFFRAAPSGGGRYPIEIYPIVMRASGINPGIYHYNYQSHALQALQESEQTETALCECTTYPEFIKGACVCFILTAMFERTMSKYSDRGYRYILLEAGHIAQNICLLATGLGLGSLCMSGMIDTKLERMLWIDGWAEASIYAVIVGHPA